jgi:2-polyprenyl-3-methyl-5-hydroxy-6-metoxy-1,4-benzoquinol methylase
MRERMTFERIWAWLADEWNVSFSARLRAALTPARETELRRCKECGLDYFSPATPATGAFYDCLIAADEEIYVRDKWEFDVALRTIRAGMRVLDVGCGSGNFLAKATANGAVGIGLEINPRGLAIARERGLDVRPEDVLVFAGAHERQFDVVSSFQVVEHLADVLPFARAAFQAVKPGGRLFLSTPNRERPAEDLTSFEYPPHHLTRWGPAQLSALAMMLGASSNRIAVEPPSRHQVLLFIRRSRALSWAPSPVRAAISRLAVAPPLAFFWIPAVTRRLGWQGHSLMVEIAKPA